MAPYDTAKEIFRRAFPSEVLRLQPPSDWLGEFPLPVLVAEYFAELGPVDVWIRGYGNPYFLPSLSGLWHYQAGYRRHPDTRECFPDWDDDWLVIADQGADPFIFSQHRLLFFMRIMARAFGSRPRCLLVWKRWPRPLPSSEISSSRLVRCSPMMLR